MDATTLIAMALLMGLAAALYSTVGHGGASAYLAIMALYSVAPETMRPTALALNLVVAGLGLWRYGRAGQINAKLLAAFVVAAAPAAFIGGGISVPPEIYRPLVGIVLWAAAIRLFWQPVRLSERAPSPPSLAVALPVGAALGLLAADLAERSMLGDTGANALGAALGLATVLTVSGTARNVVFVVLLVLTLLSEVVSFSKVIRRVPPLHLIDRLGRRPEEPTS